MKLVRHATSDMGRIDAFGNRERPYHYGRKHYFLIENASAEELEAIEDMMIAAGFDTDGCPCYEDGYTSGFHIDLSEIDDFKAAYKEAKKGLKAYMAAQAQAGAAEEAAHVEAVLAEEAEAEAEAFEVTVKGSVGVNNPFHAGDVVYVGAIENMKAAVTAMPKVGDVITATDWRGNVETVKVRQVMNECPPRPAHLQAAMDAHHDELYAGFFNEREEPTAERKEHLKYMDDSAIYIEFGAPADTAEVEAAAVRAVRRGGAFAEYWATVTDMNIVEAAQEWERLHAEALAMDAERDRGIVRNAVRRYVANEIAAPAKPKRIRRKPAVTVVSVNRGRTTWRVLMRGKTFLFTDGAKVAQQRLGRPAGGHHYKDVVSPYMLAQLKEIIRESQRQA
ncbi:DUF5417 domain-containing protein [Leclercia adecarboxylata]|uniref:DUF5417 domain-containing protein n=1 Tax=Leclercia adecarboxylata TaxID=83655 RepID=UPI003D2E04B6